MYQEEGSSSFSKFDRSLFRALLPSSRSTYTLPQLDVICKFLMADSVASFSSSIKIFDRTGPNTDPWETSLVSSCQLDASHSPSLSGPAIQPVLNPDKNVPVQVMGCQLFQEYAVGNSTLLGIKGFAEDQGDYIHSFPLIHQVCHLVIKGDPVGQAGPAPPKSMLGGSDPLSIL
ncbi:hypothetical protein BTVI_41742 [Pitangus sulphuratus]|nr:hypothetical protein BTVI_41742 [Pitangus sulphuratus]